MTAVSELPLADATLPALAGRGVAIPRYDRSGLRPRIAHVGVGGFHRAHLALYTDDLAGLGSDWGIVGLGLLPHDERMRDVLGRQDNLYTLVEKGSGAPSTRVIGSIVGFVHAPPGADDALAGVLADPVTAILSLTITESGYGEPDRAAIEAGTSTLDRLAAALDVRRQRDAGPLTVLSCDNLPGNGDVARAAIIAAAGRVGGEPLCEWVRAHCSFPNSMVDRITPMTSDADTAWLRETVGLLDGWPVVAEPFRQWVIADDFAAGRPQWERAGALFTERVHDWELYKLRMLNAGHSCMAYLSALAGFTWVDEAFADPTVHAFLHDLLHREALPTLTEIPGHPREDYIASVFERFANTGTRDQIARLCIDGSAKFPTFLLPTIAAQLRAGGPVTRSATALAAWARYLGTVDAQHQSADTYADRARAHARRALDEPTAFLDYTEVFGADLRESERFRTAFATAYRRIASDGPLAAMSSSREGTSTGRV